MAKSTLQNIFFFCFSDEETITESSDNMLKKVELAAVSVRAQVQAHLISGTYIPVHGVSFHEKCQFGNIYCYSNNHTGSLVVS